LKTAESLAKEHHVSEKTIRRDGKRAEAQEFRRKMAQAERHRHPRWQGREVCYTLCYFDRLSDLPLKTRRFPLKPAWILASKAIDATQRNAAKQAKTQS
jgi:hypothetical protein